MTKNTLALIENVTGMEYGAWVNSPIKNTVSVPFTDSFTIVCDEFALWLAEHGLRYGHMVVIEGNFVVGEIRRNRY